MKRRRIMDVHTNVIPAKEVRATTGVRDTAAAPSLVGVAGTTIRGEAGTTWRRRKDFVARWGAAKTLR